MEKDRLAVVRYSIEEPVTGQSLHPDRLRVYRAGGETLLDISMSSDSPLRPFISCASPRPWFYTGSPYGAEILAFAKECGISSDLELVQ